MLEIFKQDDGKFAVRDTAGTTLDDVLGVFDTQVEADEFILNESMLREENSSDPDFQLPGGGQGIR